VIKLLRILDKRQRALRTAVSLRLPGGPDIVNPASFSGQRVIIVGPAETIFEDLNTTCVDDYDVVVRLNNGMSLAATRPDILGHRTDVLIHNLREEGQRNAGPISAQYLNAQNVKTVICPNWGSSDLRKRYYYKRDILKRFDGPKIEILPQDFMTKMRFDLEGRAPTVGLSAALFFLDCDVAELAIHGFTFFETRYADSYNDEVKTAQDAFAWVDAGGAHKPASEKALLRKRLTQSRRPKVILGTNVKFHLNGSR
jgi:hypothetical protein